MKFKTLVFALGTMVLLGQSCTPEAPLDQQQEQQTCCGDGGEIPPPPPPPPPGNGN